MVSTTHPRTDLFILVRPKGFEPLTPTLKVWYSANWVTNAAFPFGSVRDSITYQPCRLHFRFIVIVVFIFNFFFSTPAWTWTKNSDFGDQNDANFTTDVYFSTGKETRTLSHSYELPGWNRLVTPMSTCIFINYITFNSPFQWRFPVTIRVLWFFRPTLLPS